MSLIIKCRVKDKGEITWPPIGEEVSYSDHPDERQRRLEWLREQIRQAAADTRTALGTTETRAVQVHITFKPDIMVDAA